MHGVWSRARQSPRLRARWRAEPVHGTGLRLCAAKRSRQPARRPPRRDRRLDPVCECDQACCEWCELHGDTGHRNEMYDMGWGMSFAIVQMT